MAQMIPPDPPPRVQGKFAERELWEALRHGLSDDYAVYYGLGLLERERAREGEVDFLVLHRERGMLVVECKGKGVHRGPDGRWYRHFNGRDEPTHNPVEQAQGQVKDLVKELRVRMKGLFPDRFPFVHGHAVAFPLASRQDEALPLDAQDDIVLTADDLRRIGPWVDRALGFWRSSAGKVPEPLSPADYTRFRRQVLHPELHLIETLGSRLAVARAALARLTDEQVQILRGCFEMKRVRIAGGAGSGKTALALEAARRFARAPGSHVLLICFNRMLGAHLGATVKSWGETGGQVDVTTFHALCRRAYESVGRAYAPPPAKDVEAALQFWNHTTPEVLLEALAVGALPRYDAIIVDEAQDLHAEWSLVLEESLKDRAGGRIVSFSDPAQKIFDRPTGVSEVPASYSLTTNFRNSRAIATVVRDLGRVEMEPHPRAPDGEPPQVHAYPGPSKVRAKLDELVGKLVAHVPPEQITILTPHRREHSSLSGVTELGGVALADSADTRDGKVLHTTIGAFKGLESDVVILLDIDPEDPRSDRRARYVGASRAKLSLHVFAKGDWMAA
jgi:hypothetical protein